MCIHPSTCHDNVSQLECDNRREIRMRNRRFFLDLQALAMLILFLNFLLVFVYLNFKPTIGIVNEQVIRPPVVADTCARIDGNFFSMCSCKADNRGYHQNVIAFSIYGNFSNPGTVYRYIEPMKLILDKIVHSYPGTNCT